MATFTALRCDRVTPAVGAVIEGVDAGRPLSTEARDLVQAALVAHGVVFLRGQPLSPEQLKAFAANFAAPIHEPFSPEMLRKADPVTQGNMERTKHATAVWHHDTTFVERPPYLTFLRSVTIPQLGGDTCWASMYAAYDALSEPIQRALEGLTAVHSVFPVLQRMGPVAHEHINASKGSQGVEFAHPVVIVHPVTGRKALFVNESWVTHIVELSPAESRHLLTLLFDHVKLPTFNMRWRWQADDLAVWDNRAVQHFAVPDYVGERVMQRVVTDGPRPVAA